MKNISLILLFLILFTSCNQSRFIFKDNRFDQFNTLTLKEAVLFDQKVKSKDVTPKYRVEIGKDIYPNSKGFKLNTPKIFQRPEGKFLLNAEYFYTSHDSSVKVILYEWNFHENKKQEAWELSVEEAQKKYASFEKKFNYLKNKLTKELGIPSDVEIGSKNTEDSFRDGVKWFEGSNPKAYLFMFGNNDNQYRQIRLAIYCD